MKIVSIVGARPQFIKAAVLSPALAHIGVDECLVNTGQHYDYNMSEVFFDELAIKGPAYSLEVGSASHAVQTGAMMGRIETVLLAERPDWVLVYGDTNTTLAGTLAAAKLVIPVVHIEAGLRSFNRSMPEEINRIVADHLASINCAPTMRAANNLREEGLQATTRLVGDLMVDLALDTLAKLPTIPAVLKRFSLEPKRYIVATVHRPSNTDDLDAFEKILRILESLGTTVVFPAHPRLKKDLSRLTWSRHNLTICDPLGYADMIALQLHARLIVTDSGGIQKEAYVLGVPCVTLRKETEWPETLEDGWNVLAGNDEHAIKQAAARAVPRSGPKHVFGSGDSAQKIAQLLVRESLTKAAS